MTKAIKTKNDLHCYADDMNENSNIMFFVDGTTKQKFKIKAVKNGRSMSDLLRSFINEYVKGDK